MNKFLHATNFARIAHEGQVRKVSGKPYITHSARVAAGVAILKNGLKYPNFEDMVVGSVLHDTVEDTVVTIEDIIREFGHESGRIVAGLTNSFTKKAYPNLIRKERKRLEHEKIYALTTDIKIIKMIDRIDNLNDRFADDNFAAVYVGESKLLISGINTAINPLYEEDFNIVLDELKTTIEHWEHLLRG